MTIRLNLGCSYVTGITVVGSGTALPFKDNSIDLIHCIHVLEHVKRNLYFKLLKEAYRVLRPRGEFFVEVPDFVSTLRKLLDAHDRGDHLKTHIWTTSVYGKNERPGMAHYWGFSNHLLVNKLMEAGFQEMSRCSDDAISPHYKQEPVLVWKAVK